MSLLVTAIAVAVRRTRRSPTFALFSVVTLAVGIGITTAFYSMVGALLSPPLGVEDPGTLVTIGATSPLGMVGTAQISWPDIQDIAAQAQSIERVTGYTEFPSAVVGGGVSEMASITAVSGEYFGVLGVRMALGRGIQPADDRPSVEPVAVLSHFVWLSQFRGDREVVGATVKIAGRSVHVIGVAPKEFRGVGTDRPGLRRAWVSLSFVAGLDGRWLSWADTNRRASQSFRMVARLSPGTSFGQATAEMGTIGERLDRWAPAARKRGWQVLSLEDVGHPAGSREVIWVVLALPVLVLMVACTNLANLVVSRGVTRKYDLAVRSALGASRFRLVLDELIEPVILALCGGALGVGVAHAALVWATSVLRAPIAAITGGVVFESQFEPELWGMAGLATFLAVVVFGMLPAIRVTSTGLQAIMNSDNPMAGPGWRGRRNLIALQVFASVSLSLLTLVAYAYVDQQLSAEQDMPTDTRELVMAHVPLEAQQYDSLTAQRTIASVASEMRNAFGIGAAAIMSYPPFTAPWPPWIDSRVFVAAAIETRSLEDSNGGREALFHSVMGDYFQTLSYRSLAGRFFDQRDSSHSQPVVILSEELARDLYGSTNAVGRTFHWRQIRQALEVSQTGTALVVGVVGGWQDGKRVAYAPFAQRYQPMLTILTRVGSDGVGPTADRVRSALSRADPNLAIQVDGRADTVVGGPRLVASFILIAVGVLTITVLIFSMSGLYGVLSQVVTQRRREIGLRFALGADRKSIVWLVVKSGMAPVLEGCVIGVGVAAVLRQLLQQGFRDELATISFGMLLTVIVPLLLIATFTCFFPALRSANADPNVVLRDL